MRRCLSIRLARDVFRSLCLAVQPAPRPRHILFCFADHFEPGNRGVGLGQQKARVDSWVLGYPSLAGGHRDADGVMPRHSFFFPPHYDHAGHLEKIVALCAAGYGELEMHLHHDRMAPWPDSPATLRRKIDDCLEAFGRLGVFCLPGGNRAFAFIHGDWALANSRTAGRHCGVNDELTILRQAGCFADFTFPAACEAQPRLTNTLFYGQSRPERAKAYDLSPLPVRVGKTPPADRLLMVQGPMGLRWRSRTHRWRPSLEAANIDLRDWPTPARIDYWIRKRIHVAGRPDWIFVKVHTHGAREEDRQVLLGRGADEMFTCLENRYNDGKNYVLHYVSARETYNIVKAAEAGERGDPGQYRDYLVPRYSYLSGR